MWRPRTTPYTTATVRGPRARSMARCESFDPVRVCGSELSLYHCLNFSILLTASISESPTTPTAANSIRPPSARPRTKGRAFALARASLLRIHGRHSAKFFMTHRRQIKVSGDRRPNDERRIFGHLGPFFPASHGKTTTKK